MPRKSRLQTLEKVKDLQEELRLPSYACLGILKNSKYAPRWRHPETKLSQGEHLVYVLSRGGSLNRAALELGVTPKVLGMWAQRYPEFNVYYEKARLAEEVYYEEMLRRGALGEISKFNANAAKMIFTRRFNYSDSPERSVHIENMNVLENNTELSEEELDKRIEKAQRRAERLALEREPQSDE